MQGGKRSISLYLVKLWVWLMGLRYLMLGVLLVSVEVNYICMFVYHHCPNKYFFHCFADLKKFPYPTIRLGVKERRKQILSYPEEARDWRVILSDDNLRQSSLWRGSSFTSEGTVSLSTRPLPRMVFLSTSLETLYGRQGSQIIPELTVKERAFAARVMSKSYQFEMKGPDAALEKMRAGRKKKKVTEVSSDLEVSETVIPVRSPPVIPVSTSPVRKGKERRRDDVDDADWAGDSIRLTFPFDASAYADIRPFRKELGKLLWPEDRNALVGLKSGAPDATVDHIFLGLQGVLHLSERIRELEKSVKKLRTERVDLDDILKGRDEEIARLKVELQTQLDVGRLAGDRAKTLEEQLEAVNSTVSFLTEKLKLVGTEGEVQARAQMAQDYLDGRAETWNTAKMFEAYAELMERRAEEAAEVADLAASLGGLGTGGPSAD
ncbi:uncharacterized protein LOC130989750 isoform X1 [Salvia miltiorrhiza]|uniref:uncharacterized protein LOC130989750 isoform X1 n=1 Tax=Salvia miltiorrhiza TaxID=226208 RepID=UPI0025AB67E4|nr:uncharacterized protein LOC130989750 isoform X1 [Salvia miltiorrhiza]